MTLDYKAIDVDNHYYEPLDALTRHLPREFKRRGVQMVQDGKRTWAVMGERVNHFIPTRRSTQSSSQVAWICCSAARFRKVSTRRR